MRLPQPDRALAAEPAAALVSAPRLTAAEFAEISRFVYARAGIDLRAGKEELVAARLGKKVRQGRHPSFRAYLHSVRAEPTGQAAAELVEALTTNHTSFLRGPAQFDFLARKAVPELSGRRPLRIWSAACSSGEEPCTVAACLLAESALGVEDFEILGTDISRPVLDKARRGVYSAGAVAGLPAVWLRRAFLRGRGPSEGLFLLRPEVAARIRFAWFNLLESATPAGPWHVIFCRNVMIYFDTRTRERVVNRLAACLQPGGYLLVGNAESLAGIRHGLVPVGPSIYRCPPGSALAGRRP